MRGFELGAQENEAPKDEFEGRLSRLRDALASCDGDGERGTLLTQIEDLKRVYREQVRRMQKIDVAAQ